MPPASPVFMLRRIVSATVIGAVALTGVTGALARQVASTAARSVSAPRVINGPDVSSYQHPHGARIAWHKVRAAHNDFAIVKATEGGHYRNPWFFADYGGARRAGLVRGSYHFARPGHPIVASARHQAWFYVQHLGDSLGTAATLPPTLDLEVNGGLHRAQLVAWAQAFLLEAHRLSGRLPMLYTYPSFWVDDLGDPTALARYPLWMASYSWHARPNATLWQYTSRARVNGIHGSVDMSRLLAGPETWSAMTDGRVAAHWPAEAPGAPHGLQVTRGDGRLFVHWMPGDTGSDDISAYTITAQPGGRSVTVGATTFDAVLPGLTNGIGYSVSVTAHNQTGDGAPATSQGLVAPQVPTQLQVHAPARTPYWRSTAVRVRLVRPDRAASGVAGQQISIFRRSAAHQEWQPVRTATTSTLGWVTVRFEHAVTSSRLLFVYNGPRGWRDARVQVPVVVTSRVGAALSRRVIRVRHRVTLYGAIAPRRPGVRVLRQLYYRHRWHTLQATRTHEGGGYEFTFAPRAHGIFHYRVLVKGFAGLGAGHSRTVTLRIRRR